MAVTVLGLDELQRSFRAADKALAADLKDALEEAAQPVRSTAQALAPMRIRRLKPGSSWARMRVGTTRRVVYVAPVERGTRNPRRARGWNSGPPSFPSLLVTRALEPALEQNLTQVTARVDQMLGEVARLWERTS